MGIQFPPIAFLFVLHFHKIVSFVRIFCFIWESPPPGISCTLHTSLHTRHRCENEAHIREIERAQQAWERSYLRGKVVGMRSKLVSNLLRIVAQENNANKHK